MQNINRIANDLMMEELEVALWAAYLDKVSTSDMQLGYETLLLFSAYSSKQHFTTDMHIFEAFCVHQSSDFAARYHQWRLVTDVVTTISLQELNKVVSMLSTPRTSPFQTRFSDYNALVSQLISDQSEEKPREVKVEESHAPALVKPEPELSRSDEMHLMEILSPLPSAI
jgi:hypothetical protein